jgi:membrane-bound lytic murein transglycosylase D
MQRFKPLAFSLTLFFASAPAVYAATNLSSLTSGMSQGLAAGMDMMLQNSSLLRNGDNVWERIREGFQMTEVNSDLVRRQERYYSARPDLVRRTLNRSRPYMFYIAGEVERRGMPTEIAMLPMVESSFVPSASSPVGAAGLWQFMPMTGRQYGLEQTWWYDGRRDVVAATNAALDYLQNLYTQFGDWGLALAAYNWGEGNLARAIAKTQAAGLQPTYENIRMPAETRNYVPKLLAVRNMLADPAHFGLKLDKLPNKPFFVSVSVARHMDISLAARFAGISVKEFMELNPAFNLPVYAYKSGRQMLLPVNHADRFEANLSKWDKPLLTWQVYTPTTAESAAQVAEKAGMSSAQLLAVNHISSSMLNPGRPLLIAMKNSSNSTLELTASDTLAPLAEKASRVAATERTTPTALTVAQASPAPRPRKAGAVAQKVVQTASIAPAALQPEPIQLADNSSSAEVITATPIVQPKAAPIRVAMAQEAVPQMAQASPTQHTVAAGDTLYNIAHRYNLRVEELKSLNGLKGNKLRLGQTLQLRGRTAVVAQQVQAAIADSAHPAEAIPTDYVVQHGDTLFSIARHFGLERNDIIRLNGAKKLTNLQPGQTLRLQGQ